MTLETLLNITCELAIKKNLVNYSAAGSSIYELNTKTVDAYPFIFVSPTGSIVTRKNFTDYGLTVFYVERLLEDNANDTRTYSVANDTLVNLVRQLRQLTGIVEISEPSVRLFNDERLNDRCCGAYAEITITVLNDIECGVFFDEEGDFMGTYLPDTLKELDVLNSVASKDWVAKYVADHITEGMTEEQVKKLLNNALKAYTKTEKFATINGSGITGNEIYNLLESRDFENFVQAYTQNIENIYQAISASTPSDYNGVKAQVSANTENISALSATTSGMCSTITGHTQDIERLSGITSAHTAEIQALSAQTATNTAQISANTVQISDISDNLGDLSGFTQQAVSSLTQEIENVYTAISAATPADYESVKGQVTANTRDIQTLSGVTEDLEAQIAAVSANSKAAIFDMRKYGTSTQVQREIYAEMLSAHTAGKTIFLVTNIVYSSSGGSVKSEPSIAPATVFESSAETTFNFNLLSHSAEVIQSSVAVTFGQNGAMGMAVIDNYSAIYEGPRYYLGAVLDWRFSLKATEYVPGAVTLGSGTTKELGVVNISLGSGLQFDTNGAIENPYQGNVSSQSVTNIWSGSQAEYDALGTYSNNTLYLIK